ncbi:MAG: sodium:proton antiporter [Bacteroidetes bacterium]|nr:MAG: sodium:proton antiporter [Bacteroidota bacterium]
MRYTEQDVLSALKGVVYFPKANNIVDLDMVKDIKINDNEVAFTLLFEKTDDKGAAIVANASEKTIKESLSSELLVKINVKFGDMDNDFGISKVHNIVGVVSGKGGVGKSTVAVNLALSIAKKGAKVGLIDADIYGPSVPIMLGLEDQRPRVINNGVKDIILPIEKYGIKILSIGFFVDTDQALVWRGPMAASALKQLFNDTDWGDLDYLIIDFPPGTGDIQLTVVQEMAMTGAVVVSTPQNVALADVKKAIQMFKQPKINVPILGLIENMSYFTPPELPDNKYYIFGKDGCKNMAEEYGITFLGGIPITEKTAACGDKGTPISLENDSVAKAFEKITEDLIKQVNIRNIKLPPTQKVDIK